jgi:hypothetical protein
LSDGCSDGGDRHLVCRRTHSDTREVLMRGYACLRNTHNLQRCHYCSPFVGAGRDGFAFQCNPSRLALSRRWKPTEQLHHRSYRAVNAINCSMGRDQHPRCARATRTFGTQQVRVLVRDIDLITSMGLSNARISLAHGSGTRHLQLDLMDTRDQRARLSCGYPPELRTYPQAVPLVMQKQHQPSFRLCSRTTHHEVGNRSAQAQDAQLDC